jgi:hypothetical protein
MAPKPRKFAFIFAAVFVIAALLAINTWAAVPKSHDDSSAPAKRTIYRPDLWRVY